MNFFERFNELAKTENTSVNAVAQQLQLSSGSVTAWKKGAEPSISAVIKIAQYFDVSTDYLLGLADNPTLVIDLDEDEEELLREYRKLNKKGRTCAMAEIYKQQDKMKEEFAVEHAFGKDAL